MLEFLQRSRPELSMASLLLSAAGQTCIPNSGIIKQVPAPWHLYRNNVVSANQTFPLRSCTPVRKIPEHAANGTQKLRDLTVSVASHNSTEQIQPRLGLNYNAQKTQRASSYLFRSEIGGLVKVLVGVDNMKYTVHIEVSSLPRYLNEHELILSWGIFRSESSRLYSPDSRISMSGRDRPPMKTLFIEKSLGTHAITLDFDCIHTPFYLSFLLQFASSRVATDSTIRTHRKTNFCVPVGITPGCPMPFGVSTSNDGSVNFALFSRNAESVILCLYDSNSSQPSLQIELDPYVNRTGDIWHVAMESVGNYISYGYRCKGVVNWNKGSRFHDNQILLDPYAKMIQNSFSSQGEPVSLANGLGCLAQRPAFDWSGDIHPQLPLEKMVVYRLNVGNFTKDKSSALLEYVAGTFSGVIEKLQHFISLGVNAILLEPIFSFDEQKGPYFPYHFFSPQNSYGSLNSMKEMVKTLHAHGIEVLLEVVFTHTSEGGDAASQTISFRGIDNSSYYIAEGGTGSGINNTLNCNNPVVQQLILDSLRYWLTEFHVDGFCFINSSCLLRGPNGDNLFCPPLVEAITFDPLLSQTKIIADCWSPIDMSYVDDDFPHWKRWAEMNARFCRDTRNFLRGQGLLSDLATRLCGSGDLFSDSRGPSFSFNFVTRNWGLSLVDLVSFSNDEVVTELSWNCGKEGPTEKKSVLEIRLRQIRNFLFVLFISHGVPVLNMGDECGLSTGGVLSNGDRIMDWNVLKTVFGKQMTEFIAFLSSFRSRRSDLFQKRDFRRVESIDWHGSDLSKPRWEDPSCKFLAMTLRVEKDDRMLSSHRGDLFICFNASNHSEIFILPQLREGYSWVCLVDTALLFPGFFSTDSDYSVPLWGYELEPHSCGLFEAQKNDS